MGLLSSKSPYRAVIVAMSPDRVIGINNTLPWCYPKDLRRFKELTENSTVIMGRRTWESIGRKPLFNRRNIVIASKKCPGVETYRDIAEALLYSMQDRVWFIGGAGIYKEAMEHCYCNFIDLTLVPDRVESRRAIRFPCIPDVYTLESVSEHPYDSRLKVKRYVKSQ